MRRTDLALAAVLLLVSAGMLHVAPAWTVDDAYIVARYAENFAKSGVVAFNASGPRVEGVTSPAFLAVACLASALGLSPIAAMKACATLACLALGPAIVLLGRRLGAPPLATALVGLGFVALPEHAMHARSGLETEAFVLASLVALGASLAAVRAPLLAALSLTTLAVLRPEGIGLAVVLGVAVMVRARHARPPRRARLLQSLALGFAAPVAAVTLARLGYYGSLLPNTFYAKARGLGLRLLGDLVELASRHFLDAALAAAVVLLLAPTRRLSPRERFALSVSGLALALIVGGYLRSDLTMNYGRRFAVHALPWLVAPLLVLAARALAALPRVGAPRALGAWALGLVLFGAGAFALRARETAAKQRSYAEAYVAVIERLHVPIAKKILESSGESDRLAVYPDAGYIPWATRRPTVDFGRLNDAYLARRARSPEQVLRYFVEQAPALLVLSRGGDGQLWDAGAEAIFSSAELRERYRLIETSGDPRGATLSLYARRP